MSDEVTVELVKGEVYEVSEGSVLVLRYPPGDGRSREKLAAVQRALVEFFERLNKSVLVLVLPEGIAMENYELFPLRTVNFNQPELPFKEVEKDLPFDGWGRTPGKEST